MRRAHVTDCRFINRLQSPAFNPLLLTKLPFNLESWVDSISRGTVKLLLSERRSAASHDHGRLTHSCVHTRENDGKHRARVFSATFPPNRWKPILSTQSLTRDTLSSFPRTADPLSRGSRGVARVCTSVLQTGTRFAARAKIARYKRFASDTTVRLYR